ncbi:unnamed protein product [Prorocentrum cordatum]|uniref:Uncharacterized protein n=1 Tax=Prorocentrum cordatum TaxID=2364126 RepID=A0ABN9Y923_9DINO|nr:unnamed protein product [Polarella glacialis]
MLTDLRLVPVIVVSDMVLDLILPGGSIVKVSMPIVQLNGVVLVAVPVLLVHVEAVVRPIVLFSDVLQVELLLLGVLLTDPRLVPFMVVSDVMLTGVRVPLVGSRIELMLWGMPRDVGMQLLVRVHSRAVIRAELVSLVAIGLLEDRVLVALPVSLADVRLLVLDPVVLLSVVVLDSVVLLSVVVLDSLVLDPVMLPSIMVLDFVVLLSVEVLVTKTWCSLHSSSRS